MKPVRWVEIADPGSKERFQILSEVLKKKGIENEFVSISPAVDAFENQLQQAQKEYQQIRIGTPFMDMVSTETSPMLTFTVKSVDCLHNDGKNWWPRSTLMEAVVREAYFLKTLGLSKPALVVGSGAAARAVVAALIKIGFTKVNITEKFDESGLQFIKYLEKSFFNVEFSFTSQSAITTLPGIHSLVVNTTPFIESNDLLEELYYFNFLSQGGVVIDLVDRPIMTPLLKSAAELGAKIVSGYEIQALSDIVWASWCFNVSIDGDDYRAQLKNFYEGGGSTKD